MGFSSVDWSGGHLDHQEWPAQLNRFGWLPYLAMEYKRTGDESLAQLASLYIKDWIGAHDYSSHTPPAAGDNTLSISVRLGQGMLPGWWCTIHDFIGSKAYDETFIDAMIHSTKGQLECLKAHLAPKGNWRVSHLDSILHCSLIVPELSDYTEFAVKELNETFNRQINGDGSHEEHNPTSYHHWMCRLYTRLWYLSKKRPELGLIIDGEKTLRMWDYDVHTTAPDGGSSGLHDSKIWRKGTGEVKNIKERETVVKDSGFTGKEWDLDKNKCKLFEQAGQIFMRDSWEANGTYAIFDGTMWGGAHCHLSRLAFNLYSGSRMLLYDPGILSYEMKNPHGPYGKSTPAHNTASPPGLSQTEANPCILKGEFFDQYKVAYAMYEGGYFKGEYGWYWPRGKQGGIYGTHFRVLIWIMDEYFVALDHIKADSGTEFNINWHLPPEEIVLLDGEGMCHTTGKEDNLLIRVVNPENFKIKVVKGQKDPLLGWMPDPEKGYIPSPVLCVGRKTENQKISAETILYPYKGDTAPEVWVDEVYENIFGRGLKIRHSGNREDIIIYSPEFKLQAGRMGPVETDGSLAVVSLEKGLVKGALLIDGTYIKHDLKYVIKKDIPGTYSVKEGES